MHLGFHVRVSGGYAAAVQHARDAGCDAIQVFTSNPRSYRTGAIDESALQSFAALRREAGIERCAVHTSYLINLATDDPKIAAGSANLLRYDLQVAGIGGMDYVNTHLGSYGKRDREEGFVAACRLLESALSEIPPGVVLVLENSAGAGSLCGGTLEELGRFLRSLDHPQLGVCLDTAHAWAAGYAIDSPRAVHEFLERVEAEIGVQHVRMFHFNDTEVPLGANKDRHHHIGEGLIGFEGFRALAERPELREKTAILETPGEPEDDVRNMETIRTIFKGAGAIA